MPYYPCNYLGNSCGEMQVDFLHANPNYVLPIAITLNARREQNGKSSYFSILTKKIQFPPFTYIQHLGNIYDSLDIQFIDENRGGLVG